MTEVTQLSDKELSEAINFHRRQRNLSRGVNESANMRQTQMVRMLEAEEARRLEEAQVKKPTSSEKSRALPDGEPDRSADMKVNKVAYALDKEPKKKVSLPKAPWKEEVELDEAVKVDKKNYSWGKMITVHHGSSHSFPLHPEHQEKIKNLKDGESTAFKDETGSHVTASREGDKVHLKLRGANQKTSVAHSHFTEEVQIDEDTMPGNVALRLVDRHQAAAFHHKKNGNMKGYAAHFKVAAAIEDSVIRAGRDMPIKSKRLVAASDKAFKEHPHRVVKSEEVTLDEAGMPSSVVKSKQKYSQMSDKDFADMHGHKSSEELKSMAYRHGYGKDSNEYVNKAKRGSSMKEEVELDEASEIHDKVHDIASLQKHFGGQVAGDAANHSPAMMIRKANDGKKYHLVNTSKGYHAKLAEEVELDEAPNANWADSAISHSKNQERVAKQQTKTMKAKNSAAKEFQKSSEIHAKTAKADHDTIRARTGQMEEVNKARAQQPKPVTKPSKPEEFKEEANLRITKIHNKWPKKATYAVHTPDRKYFKEFDSMEAAKAHHAEKSRK